MSAGLSWFWFRRGLWHEGRRWLETTLAGSTPETSATASALTGLGTLAWAQGDYVGAPARLEESVVLSRRRQATDELGVALMFLSMQVLGQGDVAVARRFIDESLGHLRSSASTVAFGLALASAGGVALASGDHDARPCRPRRKR